MNAIKSLVNRLKLQPMPQCWLCEQDISANSRIATSHQQNSSHWVCQQCFSALPFHRDGCQQCATPLTTTLQPKDESTSSLCGQCIQHPTPIDRLLPVFDYQYPINQWLTKYKFRKKYVLANWLAAQLARRIIQEQIAESKYTLPDALIAVPLHRRRLTSRGFNQSLLLARYLAKAFNIPLLIEGVERRKYTSAQSSLPLKQRQKNLRNAFQVTTQLPAHLAIIDDVFTTGATLNQLAHTLKAKGARTVDGWVIAYAPINKH